MLCGVTATLGSNPSATATAARPHWGRAVLLCLAGVPCGCVVPLVLLVAPLVFRAPEGPAAREARRPHFVRRRASKPARALRSLRRPPHRRRRVAVCGWARWLEARPGPAAAHGHRSLAHQSLRCPPHQWGWVADVRLGASPRSPTRPCRFLWASQGPRVLSFWGALVRVVTNVVNWRCFSCGFLPRCYKRRQSEGFFAENGGFWA